MKPICWSLVFITCFCCSQPTANPEDLSGFTITRYGDISLAEKVDAEGVLIEKGSLYKGIKSGVWSTYSNGKLISQTSYVNGELTGPSISYSNRGMIENMSEYVDNKLHGDVIKYKNGRMIEKSIYENGKIEGEYAQYYEYSDIPQRTIQFKNGKQHGLLKYYDKEGNVTLEYMYENGEKVSGGIVNKKE